MPSEKPATEMVAAAAMAPAERITPARRCHAGAIASAGAIAAAAGAIAAAATIDAATIAAGCSDGNLGPDSTSGQRGFAPPDPPGSVDISSGPTKACYPLGSPPGRTWDLKGLKGIQDALFLLSWPYSAAGKARGPGPGPWSLVPAPGPGPWSLATGPGPWPWSLNLGLACVAMQATPVWPYRSLLCGHAGLSCVAMQVFTVGHVRLSRVAMQLGSRSPTVKGGFWSRKKWAHVTNTICVEFAPSWPLGREDDDETQDLYE